MNTSQKIEESLRTGKKSVEELVEELSLERSAIRQALYRLKKERKILMIGSKGKRSFYKWNEFRTTYQCTQCEHDCLLQTDDENERAPVLCPWFFSYPIWKVVKDE